MTVRLFPALRRRSEVWRPRLLRASLRLYLIRGRLGMLWLASCRQLSDGVMVNFLREPCCWHLLTVMFPALHRRSGVCCRRLCRSNLRSESIRRRPEMLQRASRGLLHPELFSDFLREGCCPSSSATISPPDPRCAVDVRSSVAQQLRDGRRTAALEMSQPSHVLIGHHDDCTGHFEVCAVVAAAYVAAAQHASLRCAATPPGARSHAPGRS